MIIETYHNAIIGSSSSVNNAVTVSDTLTFINSKVVTGNSGALHFNSSTVVTGYNYNENSYVNGQMVYNATSNVAKEIPVGDDTYYKPVTIKPNTNAAATYGVQYYSTSYNNTALNAPLVEISDSEYWNIQ